LALIGPGKQEKIKLGKRLLTQIDWFGANLSPEGK
jgi:hypothetical protein